MVDDILTPRVLLSAYSQGYFPMPDANTEEILWFRPDPRAIIPLDGFHVSRSLKRSIQRQSYEVRFDTAFTAVMEGCADRPSTWINDSFKRAYTDLFQLGFAHSVEIWQGANLAGGTYGVAIGGAFFAESMFHRVKDYSKIALYHLVKQLNSLGYLLLECQFLTSHLASLGAIEVPDSAYIAMLAKALAKPIEGSSWRLD